MNPTFPRSKGTLETRFQVSEGGPTIKRVVDRLQTRQADDSGMALHEALTPTESDPGSCLVTKDYVNGTAYSGRYDLSVNEARVENAGSSVPTMITGTTLNAAGAFTGGGTGNKAILGFKGHSGTPLGNLLSMEWEWELVSPLETVSANLYRFPYVNLVIELSPTVYKILAIDPNQNALFPILNMGTLTPLGGNTFSFLHVPSADTNYVQVVNLFSAQVAAGIVPAMPIVSDPATGLLPVPIAARIFVPPPPPVATGSWPGYTVRYSDILSVWPLAKLIDVYTADGGLPGPSAVDTPTPSVMLSVGDSSFRRQRNVRIRRVLINGSNA